MSLRILANHAHVFPASVNPDATVDRLLKLLDACGIEQAICFAPFVHQLPDAVSPRNRWLARELTGHRRLFGFGTIDFTAVDPREQVREIVDLGFRGLKLHPNMQRFDLLSPTALELYAAAQEHNLFLSFHSGVHHFRLDHYNVLKFDEIAFQFPRLKFSLEHMGGYHFFPEALAVIFNNIPFPAIPGRKGYVYGGLASVFTPHYNRFWYLPPERLQEAVAQVGARQLIFGLDFPYNLEENTDMALRTLNCLGLSEPDLALILGGNLRTELGL